VPDPIMIAVAVALATNAVDGMSQVGRSAFAALTRLVRRQLSRDPDSQKTLATVQSHPDDEVAIGRLAEALHGAAAYDGAFADELRRLWSGVRAESSIAVDGGVTNRVSGTVNGAVVQARDVSGGIAFGAAANAHRDC
jgi:hypothetical protein